MHLIHEYGLVAVAAIIGLECLGLPVPGETALLAAAIYAGTKHDLNIYAVIGTAAGAAMAGRMIGYLIGHKFGSWLLLRYGHYVGLTRRQDQTWAVSIPAIRRENRLLRTIRPGAANPGRALRRCQSNAVAQIYACQCCQLSCLGSELWLRRILARRRVRTTAGSDRGPSRVHCRDSSHCRRNLCAAARGATDHRSRACDTRLA